MALTQARTPRTTRRAHHDAPDTERDFARLAGLPEGEERERLKQELVSAWLPMAHRLATRYRDRGENLDDLKQVAAIGLVKAVDRYDPAHGNAFESYAVPTIVGEIKRHFRDHTWDVHVPRRVQELRNRVRTAIRELSALRGGRYPTVAETAEHARLSEEEVLTGMEALESFRTLSLDAQLTSRDDDYSLLDTLGATEAGYDHVLYREAVKPEIEQLPERERRILYLRFFHDMPQARIGDELGISQMHVSRLLNRTCTRIRDAVEHDPRAAAAARRDTAEAGRLPAAA
ncbi:SigB/SigF/SigG family RNA polymerase sigma factor [Streptomyces sp. JJ36]|uniref:SigB/SigF/SigG family RNA polymerase sigma factor n=1 Tax=Streptomyces sp. JJ36 TaxID=2736645 RepID=UPI001F021914|nr:SigB/SigF/SigG family RNA polymerase sigma factor [Streptomyces sp. JJ36]MCF6525237.1 SigB/SigF/SigG family RNA polymerase sigma factor [Streptomyces sp. JJ36]